jgi:hypothetical protein
VSAQPLFELWVYLAATPLAGLTLTLVAYAVAWQCYLRSGMHPIVNPVLISVALIVAVVLDAFEQPRMAMRPNLGVAELARVPALDLAAELLRHGLHAVTDAEHRHTEIEHRGRRAVGRLFVGGHVAARQHDPLRSQRSQQAFVDVGRVDLAIDIRLADAARDQLRHLRPEIEDDDGVVLHGWKMPAADGIAVAQVGSNCRRSPRRPTIGRRRRGRIPDDAQVSSR